MSQFLVNNKKNISYNYIRYHNNIYIFLITVANSNLLNNNHHKIIV